MPFLALLGICFLASGYIQAADGSYVAAIFEHRYRQDITTQTKQQALAANLPFYEKAAKEASKRKVDIILFNEYGLHKPFGGRENLRNYAEDIPDPTKGNYNPCLEQKEETYILNALSCIARDNKIYVVGNMLDTKPCDIDFQSCSADRMCDLKCSDDGFFLFNTNVAFDREGKLVARYHKVHPYIPEPMNVPGGSEYVTFNTSFGNFGMIVCFDCIYKEAVTLSRDYGIDTLLFPTFWFDDIAPFRAVELQQAWALANKVHFLAANIHFPGTGSLGSGIYSKDFGALVYTYEPDGNSKLLIATVSEQPSTGEIIVISEDETYVKHETGNLIQEQCYDKVLNPVKDDFTEYRCYKSQTGHYAVMPLIDDSGHLNLCHDGFCCSLSYDARSLEEGFYLAVHKGINDVQNFFHWCEETCMLVRCGPFEGKPCVAPLSISNTVFKSLQLKARFVDAERVYATVSKTKERLAPKSEWDYATENGETTLTFQSELQVPLLRAGVYGRCYSKDPPYVPYYQY